MNRIITNSKSKILNFLVIISTSLLCVFIHFFLFVIFYLFREKLISSYNRLRNGNLRKIFKCILISLSIIFIILSIFTNPEKTKQVVLKIFNPEEYFKEIDKIEINGFEYTNKMNVTIDSPKNDAEISGLF